MAKLQYLTLASITPVPAGSFIVVLCNFPEDPNATFLDQNKVPLRKYWTKERRIFKRYVNAYNYFVKMKNQYWSEFLTVNNIIQPN